MKQTTIRLDTDLVKKGTSVSRQINNALKFVEFVKDIINEDSTNEMKVEKINTVIQTLINN